MTLTTIISLSLCLTLAPLFYILFFALCHCAYVLAKNDPIVIASKLRTDREIAVAKWKMNRKIKKLEAAS